MRNEKGVGITMILYRGELYETSQQANLLERMEKNINDTRVNKRLDISKVIAAVDVIGQKLRSGVYRERIEALAIEGMEEQIQTVAAMASRESLEYRLDVELGELKEPFFSGLPIKGRQGSGLAAVDTWVYPLGTLFHIAAGNREGLPVYSVL